MVSADQDKGLVALEARATGLPSSDTAAGPELNAEQTTYIPPKPPDKNDLMGSTVDLAACLEDVASISLPPSDIVRVGELQVDWV